MDTVLFVCTHNSSRSQMAEGLLRDRYGDRYQVRSAGTTPGGVHPVATAVMEEVGIDISDHTSEHVDAYAETPLDVVVAVCNDAAENCPYIPARKQNLHQGFDETPPPSRAPTTKSARPSGGSATSWPTGSTRPLGRRAPWRQNSLSTDR
jgi:arsenate reductase